MIKERSILGASRQEGGRCKVENPKCASDHLTYKRAYVMLSGGTISIEANKTELHFIPRSRESTGPKTFSLVRHSGNRTETRRNARKLC